MDNKRADERLIEAVKHFMELLRIAGNGPADIQMQEIKPIFNGRPHHVLRVDYGDIEINLREDGRLWAGIDFGNAGPDDACHTILDYCTDYDLDCEFDVPKDHSDYYDRYLED